MGEGAARPRTRARMFTVPSCTACRGAWPRRGAGRAPSAFLRRLLLCSPALPPPAAAGAVWGDQLVNGRKYVRRVWTVAVLALITAIFITMSLLPLLDPWYQAAALVAGAGAGAGAACVWVCTNVWALSSGQPYSWLWCLERRASLCPPRATLEAHSTLTCVPSPTPTPTPTAGFLTGCALLLAPRVARNRRRHRVALVALCHCAVLVVGGLAVGAVGVALNARVGSDSSFLKDSCCVGFGSWQCVPSGGSPTGCYVEAQGSGGRVLYCPSVRRLLAARTCRCCCRACGLPLCLRACLTGLPWLLPGPACLPASCLPASCHTPATLSPGAPPALPACLPACRASPTPCPTAPPLLRGTPTWSPRSAASTAPMTARTPAAPRARMAARPRPGAAAPHPPPPPRIAAPRRPPPPPPPPPQWAPAAAVMGCCCSAWAAGVQRPPAIPGLLGRGLC